MRAREEKGEGGCSRKKGVPSLETPRAATEPPVFAAPAPMRRELWAWEGPREERDMADPAEERMGEGDEDSCPPSSAGDKGASESDGVEAPSWW